MGVGLLVHALLVVDGVRQDRAKASTLLLPPNQPSWPEQQRCQTRLPNPRGYGLASDHDHRLMREAKPPAVAGHPAQGEEDLRLGSLLPARARRSGPQPVHRAGERRDLGSPAAYATAVSRPQSSATRPRCRLCAALIRQLGPLTPAHTSLIVSESRM